MKNIIFTFILLITFVQLNAQVSLNHTYNYSASVVKLEFTGYKYYLMDVPAAQCRIYNLDHSLYKTINCNIPGDYYLSDIKFISENLFDTDPGIELLCTFYKYNSSLQYYIYESKIINDDGSEITFIDGSMYNYINQTGENEWKLFSYCYDFSIYPEKVWTNIYNLPATTVSAQFINKSEEILYDAFPNPVQKEVNIYYSLPDQVRSGKLYLIDNTGKTIRQFIVDDHSDHLSLDVSMLKSGIYHYFIEYGQTKTVSKQLLIN